MADIRNDLCLCGKALLFENKEKAWEYINKESTKGLRKLVNVHSCSQVAGIWHVTSKVNTSRNKLSALEKELHSEMATAREAVIQFIKDNYRATGEYKVSTRQVKEYLEKRKDYYSTANNVSTAIYQMKKDGILTELDEVAKSTRGGRPSKYFTLTSILEEVTNPKSQGEEVSEKKVPVQSTKGTPITVAANPFDKVNDQLKLILTQLQGLATGYSDLVKSSAEQTNLTRNVDSRYDQLLELLNSAVTGLNREESFSLNAINDLKEEIKSNSGPIRVEVPASAVAEEVNKRLSDLRRDDSFIYAVREELDEQGSKTDKHILEQANRVNNQLQILFEAWKQDQMKLSEIISNITVPPSVANPDDYKAGLKEGIRLAAEMGITVKSE